MSVEKEVLPATKLLKQDPQLGWHLACTDGLLILERLVHTIDFDLPHGSVSR
jgi:hypothetical protein